ncbi:penicillin-binding protein 1C [Legionella waltersii]|uniref:peptidoglycan glycosyltransferase n=1 Tax=Legionella waltersii TaxID=66969 RepID=A0A0W1A1C1_9GAMM|nr:penicillin-binding protein 1C [Legionella waltersii]KTD75150.1 penicillin binding protein 1C, peptidoglycan biosynthesis [Legionella waltersii]SNV04804.1 penicillin binding protein 1C, peptidoglycan biosynthesis [Legionella waltersii]
MRKIIKIISIILVSLFVSAYAVLFFSDKPALLDKRNFSTAIYDSKHRLLRLTLSQDEKYRLFAPLKEIAPQLIEATLLQEDQYYRWHSGVNSISLFKAIWQTYFIKSRRVGASTISMQVARMHYGINTKTISGKLLQMYRALQIEYHYTKNEILEAYLNLAPYGGNIEGVGAASLIYFGKSAQDLTLPESLTLAIIPQNPVKRGPKYAKLQEIRNRLFDRWVQIYPQDKQKMALFALPLSLQTIHNLPFLAPHFTNQILQNPSKTSTSIESSLDYKLQAITERITRQYISRKNSLGVTNASVLLVDTRDMGIKAMIGSVGFFNKEISGQINGVDTKRSPGSTLKPFIYGLAIDQGLIHPATVLKDVPHSFNGYNPENFDYDFMGPIKAKDALVLSRNIPAIYLASQLKQNNLYHVLEQARVSGLRSESYYGLSLNLGGVELTMKELVSLYAMLVNDGVWYPIHSYHGKGKQNGRRLLSSEASFLVLDILEGTPTKDLVHKSHTKLPVGWKTGTSSGYRDAWTVGVFGPYVLGVWIGNFDNKSNPAFIGKEIAAPLFFEIIDAIQHEVGGVSPTPKHPEHMNLEHVEVCKASGMLPTKYCTDTEWTWFIPGKSPITTDTIFREVAINNRTGLRTCHVDENTRFEIFEFWPSDILKVFKSAGVYRHTPPPFEPNCPLTNGFGISPKISSPQAGVSYVVRATSKSNNAILFNAVTDAGIRHLYWFINEAFIAKTRADEPYLWDAKPGKYTVRVVDDRGLSDSQEISIELST